MLEQTCSGPVGRQFAQSLAQHLAPTAQPVADFLQWHITGIAGARICLSGTQHNHGTRWTIRAEAPSSVALSVRRWAEQQGQPIEEWCIAS